MLRSYGARRTENLWAINISPLWGEATTALSILNMIQSGVALTLATALQSSLRSRAPD